MSGKVYTVREVAEMLKLSESAIRNWVFNNTIPYIRIGGAVRFKEETIKEIMEKGL